MSDTTGEGPQSAGAPSGLDAELQRGDAIALIWNIHDVQTRADLSDEQARAVLAYVEREHDPEIGLNWTRIDAAIQVCGFELF